MDGKDCVDAVAARGVICPMCGSEDDNEIVEKGMGV